VGRGVKRVDIAIIGLGVHGSAAARVFAARGWSTLAVESAAYGEVIGASRGPVRMVRTNGAAQMGLAGLAAASVGQWQALSAKAQWSLYRPVAGVIAGTTSASGHPIAADDAMLAELAIPTGWFVTRDNACGLLEACPAVLALRECVAANGAELWFERTAELEDEPLRDSPTLIRIGRDRVVADRVLCCVGAWSPQLPRWARILGLRVQSADMQVAAFDRIPAALHEAFYVFNDDDDRFCAMPVGQGAGVQFGHFSSSETANAHADATWHRDVTKLRQYFPELGAVRERATIRACYTFPPSGSFVLRSVSPRAAILVACSGIGFKFAPAIADQVVAVFEGGAPSLPGLRVEDERGVEAWR